MNVLGQLELSELIGIVEEFPWFAAARKELGMRTGELDAAALYMGDRSILYGLDLKAEGKKALPPVGSALIADKKETARREIRVVGGDYFSQEEYENAGEVNERLGRKRVSEQVRTPEVKEGDDRFLDFCTETLAGIYAEQGYFDKAKLIYSKLILRYPEKNAYFAALIQKLDANN